MKSDPLPTVRLNSNILRFLLHSYSIFLHINQSAFTKWTISRPITVHIANSYLKIDMPRRNSGFRMFNSFFLTYIDWVENFHCCLTSILLVGHSVDFAICPFANGLHDIPVTRRIAQVFHANHAGLVGIQSIQCPPERHQYVVFNLRPWQQEKSKCLNKRSHNNNRSIQSHSW